MSDERHASGHDGVYELHDDDGNVTGYRVEGCKTIFGTRALALAWLDSAAAAPALPDPNQPRRGLRR